MPVTGSAERAASPTPTACPTCGDVVIPSEVMAAVGQLIAQQPARPYGTPVCRADRGWLR